jgi:hypothetical protein
VKNIASPDKNEIRLRRLVPASVFTALHRDKTPGQEFEM